LNSTPENIHIVFEEGFRIIPAWILFRHILVFCYSMGIADIATKKGKWVVFIHAIVQCRMATSFEPVYETWAQIVNSLIV
jgi:Na+-transporting NADH:ubiquinone oxidoreductase subunit NqrB